MGLGSPFCGRSVATASVCIRLLMGLYVEPTTEVRHRLFQLTIRIRHRRYLPMTTVFGPLLNSEQSLCQENDLEFFLNFRRLPIKRREASFPLF